MSRPQKNTVDYFPHIIQNGKTMFVIESKYGNDGYAFWFKLLELLGSSNNHVYDCNKPDNWEFLLAKTKVSNDIGNEILNTLSKLDAIDSHLWQNKIIWCQNFVDGIADVYKRRTVEIPKKPVLDNINDINVNKNHDNDNINPQSKAKETKVNQIKANESKADVSEHEKNVSHLLSQIKEVAEDKAAFEPKKELTVTTALINCYKAVGYPMDKFTLNRTEYSESCLARRWFYFRYKGENGELSKPMAWFISLMHNKDWTETDEFWSWWKSRKEQILKNNKVDESIKLIASIV